MVCMWFRFVEQEVERVKVLFEQKEGRLRSERDAAQRQLQEVTASKSDLEEQVDITMALACTKVLIYSKTASMQITET